MATPMVRRAVEITGDSRYLCKEQGFLVVCEGQAELGRLPLDDLEVVLVASRGVSCTGGLLNALAERCIPLVLCDQRFLPQSLLWPVESHTHQSGRIRAQAGMSAPLRKRIWQQLVRAKIERQIEALRLCTGQTSPRLERLAAAVLSGDSKNIEGEAARVYWPLLFGAGFRRDRKLPGLNTLLNYGYTVLRAGVARAVMLAGLHPAFSVHHCSQRDTMPLVDDLIEPFRPVVDLLAYTLAKEAEGPPDLTPAAKERLATVTAVDMCHDGMASPVSECLLRMTRSFADVCEGKKRKLELPDEIGKAESQPEP